MSKKVLIIEDDELIAFLHKKYIQKCGAEVVGSTCDFEEFHELVKKHDPDVILSDIFLGGDKDGIDFIMSIAGTRARVIYATASTDPSTLEKAKKTVFHQFLVKPVLLQNIRELLDF